MHKPAAQMIQKRYGLKKVVFVAVILALASGSVATAAHYYNKYQKVKDPQVVAQGEAQDLAKKVDRLMSVPQNETPTIATVSDKEQLKGHALFANAENGDKVLIYATAKKAVLYRPSQDKVIEAAPLKSETSATQKK